MATYAPYHNHAEVLRWARENGCPWDAKAQDRAARSFDADDDFGNVEPPSEDEWYSYEFSDEEDME